MRHVELAQAFAPRTSIWDTLNTSKKVGIHILFYTTTYWWLKSIINSNPL